MSTVVDLSAGSGLPITLDTATGLLSSPEAGVVGEPGVRRLGELRDVLRDPAVADSDPDRACYLLYRDVRDASGSLALGDAGLRYDLTVTLPGDYGDELPKTAGHYHGRAPDGVLFPEIYEVLHGSALFVLQRVNDAERADPAVLSLWLARCEPGDKIVIPPDCGHLTVNVGAGPLVVSDLVATASINDYGSYRSARGAACHVLRHPSTPDGHTAAPNPRYPGAPDAARRPGNRWSPFLPDRGPLHTHAIQTPDAFAFLLSPAGDAAAMFELWAVSSER
ncbi:MAG: glucose-6-phosphate isomerase family protein [Thermomicrobiales bacterium]